MSEFSPPPPNPLVPYAPPARTGLFARFRTWFLTGVLIVAPLALTLYVCLAIVSWVDQLIAPLIPPPYRPEVYFNLPFAVPGTVSAEQGAKLEQAWRDASADLIALRPQTPHMIATGSDHFIQIHQPDLVVAGVRLAIQRSERNR